MPNLANTRVRVISPPTTDDVVQRARTRADSMNATEALRRLRRKAHGADVATVQVAVDALVDGGTRVMRDVAARARRVAREADKVVALERLRRYEADLVEQGVAEWIVDGDVVHYRHGEGLAWHVSGRLDADGIMDIGEAIRIAP